MSARDLRQRIVRALACGVLEPYAPEVPGLYFHFPSRSQISPASKTFVDVARSDLPKGGG